MTLPGFLHDVCLAVHPLAAGSPFFRTLPLDYYGLEFIHSPAALAHPFDDGTAALLERSIVETGERLGLDDVAYCKLMQPLVSVWNLLERVLLSPPHLPRHPLALARFGLRALRSACGLAESRFKGERERALFAGLAAHSMLPLEQAPSAACGLVRGITGHVVGWPVPRGGAQRIADALVAHLRELGGEIVTKARKISGNSFRARRCGSTGLRSRDCTSVRHRRRPAAAEFTACAVTSPHEPLCWTARSCAVACARFSCQAVRDNSTRR